MKNKLLILLAIFTLLVGCTALSETISVEKRVISIPIFHPPLPDSITMNDVKWKVLTPEIMEQLVKDEKEGKPVLVIFYGLTPKQYEALAGNMQELKRYIKGQKAIIKYYRDTNKKTEDK